MQALGKFLSDAFDLLDFPYGGLLQFWQGLEVLKEFFAAFGTETGTLVECGFTDSFASQLGVEGVGEAVGFVAESLEETQGWVSAWELEIVTVIWEDDAFLLLGETD